MKTKKKEMFCVFYVFRHVLVLYDGNKGYKFTAEGF